MATAEQQEFLRSLEEEKSALARAAAARQGRFMRSGGGGLNVTIARAAAQNTPVNAGPINFTVTFNKVATGFTNADISFTGSTVGGTLAAAVTGTGPAYNVAVTGMTGNGLVRVSFPAGGATDALGAPFPASNSATVMFDTSQPSVTINQAAGQADPTSTALINFTVIFSEPVTGFTSSDVSTVGSTVTGVLSPAVIGSGTTYNVAIMGATGAGNVVASIPAGAAVDAAGNTSLASTSTDNTVAFDPGGSTGFPDATNTGPLIGTSFTNVSGLVSSTSDGQTIQNLNLTGRMFVGHNNVTIQDCNIHMDSFFAIKGADGLSVSVTGTVIRRCRIFGDVEVSGIWLESMLNATISFCDISNVENGIVVNDTGHNIHDNYIHHLAGGGSDPHIDAIQFFPGSGTVSISHNNLDVTEPVFTSANSCITMNNVPNITISNNRLSGGTYSIYFEGTSSGCNVINNRFGPHQFDYVNGAASGAQTYSGNVDDTTGLPILGG